MVFAVSTHRACTQLCLFAEGTRFTPEKHKISVEFAESRGLPVLKHHLFPRTKGFCFILKNMKAASELLCMTVFSAHLYMYANSIQCLYVNE